MPDQAKIRKIIYISFWAAFVGALLGIQVLIGGYFYLARDLPPLYSLRNYHPAIVTEVYSDNGALIAEFAEQRRRIVDKSQISPFVKKAFVATEDHRFLEHRGVDWYGVVRAFVTNIEQGQIETGASTITMQVARTFFFTREKKYSRKLREAILAVRIERYLTKEEILYLYLSQIDLGKGCYGVAAASEYYFGKPVGELGLAEAAMLAGIPPAPSRFNPVTNYALARKQQWHVLRRMAEPEVSMITMEAAEQAFREPIRIVGRSVPAGESAPDFTEQVRRLLVDKYGFDKVYREGLKVFTTVNLDADQAAARAVRQQVLGPRGLDKNLGYRGPVGHLAGDTVQTWLRDQENKYRDQWVNEKLNEALAEPSADKPARDELRAAAPSPIPLLGDRNYQGIVEVVDDAIPEVWVRVGLSRGRIAKKDMAWAGKYHEDQSGAALRKPSEILARGDLVLVRVLGQEEDKGGKSYYRFALEQDPVIEAGLFSISVRRGHVKALCGGVQGEFIRPLQARRQPGSAMKPLIYAAALDEPQHRFTPGTIIIDSAMVFEKGDQACGLTIWERYQPKNYSGSFTGPQTFRTGLAKSINTIAVKIACTIGLDYTIEYIHRLGVKTLVDKLPCLPLGCSELTLEELSMAYNVFASGGYLMEPIYISRVYDRDGNLLEYEEKPPPESPGPGLTVAAGSSADPAAAGNSVEPGTQALDSSTSDSAPLAAGTRDELKEEDIAGEESLEAARISRHFELSRAAPPGQLGEPTWEEYLAQLRSGELPWLDPASTPPRGKSVISPQTAFLMNSLLHSVVTSGTATAANRLGRPLAGKTGTTNNWRDALFVGYSPELLTGVWVGADDYSYSLGKGVTGSQAALPIWMDYMGKVLAGRPGVDFVAPPGIQWVSIDTSTGLRANEFTPPEYRRTEAFIKGTAPEESAPPGATLPARPDYLRDLDGN